MAKIQIEQQPTEDSKTEIEAGHFMNSKENRLYYFIRLELLRL